MKKRKGDELEAMLNVKVWQDVLGIWVKYANEKKPINPKQLEEEFAALGYNLKDEWTKGLFDEAYLGQFVIRTGSEQVILRTDAFFNTIDLLELKHARAQALSAQHSARNAFILAIISAVISAAIGIAQLFHC